ICAVLPHRIQNDVSRNKHIPFLKFLGKPANGFDGKINDKIQILGGAWLPHTHSAMAPPIRYSTLEAFNASRISFRKAVISRGWSVMMYRLAVMPNDALPVPLVQDFPGGFGMRQHSGR